MGNYKFDWGKVTEKIKTDETKKGFKKDERFWKHTPDKEGNATAIIRFLPDADGNPYSKYYQHNFSYMDNGVKKYWIRNCLNTFGYDRECPICKKNQEYWNSAFESDKKLASERKRKLTFISNILVIKNPNNPEDEGKVFLYSYGQKIWDKIKDKWFPSAEIMALGEGSYDEYIPFDLYEGADFKLVVSKQGEFPNYDKSEFGKQKPVGNDKQIDAIMSKVYGVAEFIDESKYPTNDDVVAKLGVLLGLTVKNPTARPESRPVQEDVEPQVEDITETETEVEAEVEDEPSDAAAEDDDSMADFFKNLK